MTADAERQLVDSELLELLADDAELYAIADAIYATHGPVGHTQGNSDVPRSRIQRRWIRPLLIAAALATALVVGLVSPWSGPRGGLVQRALAAVGDGRVIHAILQTASTDQVVDVSSGAAVKRTVTTEIWFDTAEKTQAMTTSIAGSPIQRLVEDAKGGWSDGGPVITCSWIATHPAMAARLNVECRPGDLRPAVDAPFVNPAIVGFIDHYRSALASGEAREVGSDDLNGRAVTWLEIAVPSQVIGGQPLKERVAVDATTYAPVLIQQGDQSIRVSLIESAPFDASDFDRPLTREKVSASSVADSSDVPYEATAAALDAHAVALGTRTTDFVLARARMVDLTVGYGPFSTRPIFRAPGLEYEYSPTTTSGLSGSITLSESLQCAPGWGWRCDGSDPTPGYLLERGPVALTRLGPLYVTIWNWHRLPTAEIVGLVRSLAPVSQTH